MPLLRHLPKNHKSKLLSLQNTTVVLSATNFQNDKKEENESIYLCWNLNLLMARTLDPTGEKRHLKFVHLELEDSFFGNIALLGYNFFLQSKVRKYLKGAVAQMNYFSAALNPDSLHKYINLFQLMEAKFINQLEK